MVHTNTFRTRRTRRKDLIRSRLGSDDPTRVIDALWEAVQKLDDPPFVQEAAATVAASLDPKVRLNAILVLLEAVKKPARLDPAVIGGILGRARQDTNEHVRGAAVDVTRYVRQELGWRVDG